MNIKKIEKQLKKINQLFEAIKDDGSVSIIEKDLMLSYVRGLYEKILDREENNNSGKKEKSNKSKVKMDEKIVERTPLSDNLASVVMQEVVKSDIAKTDPNSNLSHSSTVQETVVQEVIEEPKNSAPQEILDLFKFEAIHELSDKLSRAPIHDLTKCMGINERIFTVQELFGGDSGLFINAMKTMDRFTSLEQARDYLVEVVAVDQNWAEDGKLKKAANFIKLISRRYQN